MTSIYGCAYLTLVAACGKDAGFGLPGVDDGTRSPDCSLSLMSKGRELCLVPKRPSCFSLMQKSMWWTRGWTYQEYQLSPRAIIVTSVETFLVIGNLLASERYETGPIRSTTTVSKRESHSSESLSSKLTVHEALIQSGRPSWSHYGNALVAFTQRSLTNPGDRLAAFMGILNRFCEGSLSLEDQAPLSGLPYQWFYASLLWEARLGYGQPLRVHHDGLQSRALPSWSWVGWTGPVQIHGNRLKPRLQNIQVAILDEANIKCESFTIGVHNRWPFGPSSTSMSPVKAITLHLWATIIELYIVPHRQVIYYLVAEGDQCIARFNFGVLYLDPGIAARFCSKEKHQFIIFDWHVMLVEKQDDHYERRGLGNIYYSDDPFLAQRTNACIEKLGRLEHIKLR